MNEQITLLLTSFAISFVLSFIAIPILKKLKVGQIERSDGPQSHLKKQGTPTMGGIIMMLTIILMAGITFLKYKGSEWMGEKSLLILAFITIGFGVVGLVDDLKKLVGKNTKGLEPKLKMLGLLIIAVIYVVFLTNVLKIGTDISIPFFDVSLTLPIWLYIPFAVFVLLATTNAVNLTDGVDGLATTITTIIFACLTVIGVMTGNKEVAMIGSILVGTCLSFLLFNLHPAKVMMGDTSSLLLGGAMAGIALYLKMPLLLLIIALIPVVETLSVMIQVISYKKTGKRVFKMAPIHHHFELCGWKENKVVAIFGAVTLILCVIGLMSIS